MFILIAVALLAFVLFWLLRSMWTPSAAPAPETEAPALRILREQRSDLDEQLSSGQITANAHAHSLDELAQRVLAESALSDNIKAAQPRKAWAIATASVVTLCAITLYALLGNPAALDPAQRIAPASVSPMQIDAMVEKLAAKVAANPDDLDGLRMLARSYMVLERFQEASDSFATLAQKQPSAQAYADWADALASAQGGKLPGPPAKLVEKALALDPNNVKALALAGTIAFDQADFKTAIRYWETMSAQLDPQSEMAQSAKAMLAEARSRGGLPAQSPKPAPSQQTSALQARGRISLAASLSQQALSPDATLFVFARPAAGGPPLAALRFKASDLPLSFDFSQASLMLPGMPVPARIIIGARISSSGNPSAQAGDLQGFSAEVAPDANNLQVSIDARIE